jgi:outer membrane receptor protein involved in Fe transport
MKTLFTFLVVACSYVTVLAEGNAKITGTVTDSTSTKPVEFATVALTDANGKVLDGAICDDKGKFTLNKVQAGEYILSVTFIGFKTKNIPLSIKDNRDVDLGNIVISPVAQVLKEVTVEGERSVIEERVDRTIYNAENDATAKGGDATDVLKRVPMLSVDMDGNVSLRGNQNILVLINNKPSTIVASSVADALKQIPADQIKTVEVITSPSAKYDAEGSAGIINIVTKKNNLQGLTLNVDSGVGYRGSNLGLNGNYRKGKMGFSLGGFARANYNVNGSFNNTQITIDTTFHRNTSTTTIQQASTRNRGLFGNYNFGWDYDINEKNSLAASVRFGVRNGNSFQDNLQQITNDVLNKIQNIDNKDQSNNVDASLTYTHLYAKPQRELSFQGLYSRNNRNSIFENLQNNVLVSSFQRFKNLNDAYNQEITIQGDYQTPIGTNQMLELGGKNIMRRAVSDYTSYNADGTDGPYVLSPNSSNSNNLNYDQNVSAGYLSYTYTTKGGYSFKGGSRYEYTTINAYTKTESNISIPSYGVVVPSFNVSKKLKGGNMLKASYNRRIQRPSIRFLNPNIQQQNPLNVTIGNPRLTPEFTNNYELAYSTFIKGTTLNFSGFARNTNDAIQSIRDIIGNDKTNADTIRTRYQNIGVENAYGMSIFANVNIGKLTLNGGSDVYYAMLDNKSPDPRFRTSNEGWVASGRIFGSYNLTKDWGFQFFSFMRGRQVQLQGTQGGFYMYSLAIRKQFDEKRGSIGVGVENFLQKSIKIKNKLESPILIQNSTNVLNNLSFRVNFSYRIGKMSMENRPRRRRSINNDDLKEGDNGGGNQIGDAGQQGGQQGGGGNPQMQMGGGQRPQGLGGAPGQANKPPVQNNVPRPTDGVVYEAAGTWTYTIDSPQGGGGVITIKKENGVYSATVKSDRMKEETPVTSITVNGNDVSLSYNVNFGGNQVTIDVKSTINNDDMNGTMALGQFRTFNLTGKRSK